MNSNNDTHRVTATVAIAGEPEFAVSAHGGHGEAGSHLTVTLAGVIIWFYDQRAVRKWAQLWNDAAGRIFGASLPEARDLATDGLRDYAPTIAVRATGHDMPSINPRGECVTVRLGHLTWAVYDQRAWQHQVQIWAKVTTLAEVLLPDTEPALAHRRDRMLDPATARLDAKAKAAGYETIDEAIVATRRMRSSDAAKLLTVTGDTIVKLRDRHNLTGAE